MIISRKEFYQRTGMMNFKTKKIQEEIMEVKTLYNEIKKDAPFRNHSFMFDKNKDWRDLELQEKDGIFKKFPKIKTERERYEKIKEEILNDTYESVPLLKDLDYPNVFYVNNGFHRIWIVKELGRKFIRVKSSYGKFNLGKSINFKDLSYLLDMLSKLFKEKDSIVDLNKFLKEVIKKKPLIGESYSIGYGR